MNARRFGLAWLCCTGLLSLPAHAGRPLVSEDAGILAVQDCEWESAALSTRQHGQPTVGDLSTQLGCGIGLDTQFALALGRSHRAGTSEHSVALAGKTGLVDGGDEGTSLALAWGLVAFRPSGAGLKQELSFLNLAATRSLGAGFTGHANLGLTHSRSARATLANWNLALEWAQRPGLEWMGEIYGVEHSKPWLGLGLRWSPDAAWSFNASWATQREIQRIRLISLGVKLAF